mmetsp:Transcript_103143/g.330695  ORF Transcript_103143/g.330695 Transcript_103143/m.330695 type:complete len:494 (-) Transcript_103143:619-2100(-)
MMPLVAQRVTQRAPISRASPSRLSADEPVKPGGRREEGCESPNAHADREVRYAKVLQLLHEAFVFGEKARLEPAATALAATSWGMGSLFEALDCRPTTTAPRREREQLERELQSLCQRREAAMELLDEVEVEVFELGREITQRSERRAVLKGSMSEQYSARRCPGPTEDCYGSHAVSVVSVPTRFPDAETRAILRERLDEAQRELGQLRQEMETSQEWQSTSQEWQNLEVAKLQNVTAVGAPPVPGGEPPRSLDVDAAAQQPQDHAQAQNLLYEMQHGIGALEGRADVRGRMRRRGSAVLRSGQLDDAAQLQLTLRRWAIFARQRGLLGRTLQRSTVAAVAAGGAPEPALMRTLLCFLGWRCWTLDSRRLDAEQHARQALAHAQHALEEQRQQASRNEMLERKHEELSGHLAKAHLAAAAAEAASSAPLPSAAALASGGREASPRPSTVSGDNSGGSGDGNSRGGGGTAGATAAKATIAHAHSGKQSSCCTLM